MKKFFMCFVLCLLFVFVGCGSNSEDSIYGDDTDSTDSQNNDENADTDKTDSDNTDSDKTDSDNTDTDKTDSDNTDSDNTDTDKTDSDNTDSDNTDTDKTDSDNPDSDNPDTDNPDTDNPDTGSETECTGISLYVVMPYYEGNYYGAVTSISGESSYDMIYIEFYNGIAVASYDLSTETNSDYQTCTECLRVEGTDTGKMFFQESGTLAVSAYNPETFELNATITAKLVETTFASNGHSTPKEDGACIEIEAGTFEASDPSEETATCADIMDCFDTCPENDNDCKSECFSNSTAAARTQYVDLQRCDMAHNCEGNYYCYWENCLEEEEICGMKADTENYNIPYGEVEINGTFNYLHAEDTTEISYSHAIEGAFVTGTFGNNNTPIVDPSGQLLSYAKIAPFKDVPEERNITLIQTYKNDGNTHTPTVHFVTTVTEPGEYTLGLGDWTTEARIFISETDSTGERTCDHAFGVGNVTISAISWATGTTTISVNGTATLYSYKASPHYGGDISGTEWVACDPKN